MFVRIIAVALLVVGFAGTASAQFQQQPQPQPQPVRPRPPAVPTPERGSDLSPLSVKILPGPDAEKKAKAEEQERQQRVEIDRQLASATQRIADYTFWAGLFVLGLVLAVLGQIALFWSQLRTIREVSADSQRASTAAEKAAEATAASIEVNRGNGMRQLRAYVFSVEPKIANVDGAGGIAEASVTMKNTGRTPAYDVTHRAAIRLAPFPAAAAVFDITDSQPDSKFILARGEQSQTTVSLGRALSAEEKTQLQSGKMAIYVFGVVKYNDTFGVPRTTEYRMMVGGNVGLMGQNLFQMADGNRAT